MFISGAQQDLITLTLDPVAGTAPSQFEVFHTFFEWYMLRCRIFLR